MDMVGNHVVANPLTLLSTPFTGDSVDSSRQSPSTQAIRRPRSLSPLTHLSTLIPWTRDRLCAPALHARGGRAQATFRLSFGGDSHDGPEASVWLLG